MSVSTSKYRFSESKFVEVTTDYIESYSHFGGYTEQHVINIDLKFKGCNEQEQEILKIYLVDLRTPIPQSVLEAIKAGTYGVNYAG